MTKIELNLRLFQILGSDELVAQWWHSPNRYWDGATPYSIWTSDPQSVEKYINFFLSK